MLIFVLSPLAVAQTPVRIHDLKSLTDSSGTDHLFYRIYAEYEGTEYFTDNIYHLNVSTGVEELFLEHYYDTRFGYEDQNYVNEYRFFENDPQKFIYIGSSGFEVGYIERHDTLSFLGFLTFPVEIEVSGNDTSDVYAFFQSNGTIIGHNGGKKWPKDYEINEESVPDSLKLSFNLSSISPYDKELMFDYHGTFLRSIDRGKTYEVIAEGITPNTDVHYDADSSHIYLMNNSSLYSNSQKGESEFWEKKIKFSGIKKIVTHPAKKGELYVWSSDSIFVSKNYGESFESVYANNQNEINGVRVESNKVFISTNVVLYMLEDGFVSTLQAIPTRNENEDQEIPSKVRLNQNYPNPFNPSTIISFDLENPSTVSLRVYNSIGHLIQEILKKELLLAGQHEYHFKAGQNLGSGIYFYVLSTEKESFSKKMMLIK